MKIPPLACFLAACILAARADDVPPVSADGTPQPGHSSHGEAFNEGPRQKAVLMEGTGHVHFPVTTSNELAQKFFDQGVGQLHGFWYFEAERSFRQVASLDPDCAMAFWGMAMANVNNAKRAAEFIKSGTALKEKVSRREQLWLATLADFYGDSKDDRQRRLNLVKALEKLSFDFPDDIEAKAFMVFWIWDNESHGIPNPSSQALDSLAQQVLASNPLHPIHHYRIHLWNGDDDRRAIESAALCGQVSPAIAHMWHMPGHTFTRLHRYADAAWQQEAAARVDHAHMNAARILPEQIHNYAHNNDWLVEDLEYIGRVHDAIALAKNMIELPRPAPKPVQNGKASVSDTVRTGYSMGRQRLLETALRFELWPELAELEGSIYLAPSEDPPHETHRLLALGTAHYALGDETKGNVELSALEADWAKVRADRLQAADAAEAAAKKDKKSPADTSSAMASALQSFSARLDATSSAIAELKLNRALSAARLDEAKTQLAELKNLPPDRLARINLQLGDKVAAARFARDAEHHHEGEVLPLANLVDILWQVGKKAEARDNFSRLLPLCAQVDLDTPVFARLAPIAHGAPFNLPDDWRPKLEWPKDSGERPDLAKLGPFRWHPYLAPSWRLTDKDGQPVSMDDFRGKPVLILFYLGSGCALCVEQLNLFGPRMQEFADAGITVLAVSADPAESLHETFALSKDSHGFPFTILADPKLTAFKAYRAFDDFENIPLHGTFLIDSQGLVRWQDISFQAFRDPQWLLSESKRLLALPPALSDGNPATSQAE